MDPIFHYTVTHRSVHAFAKQSLAALLIIGGGVISAPARLGAQGIADTGPQRATRTDLIALKTTIDNQIATGIKGERLRDARFRSSAITTRLTQGDFRVGDRFLLSIQQGDLKVDTASVRDSMWVTIPSLPDFSVVGVLRSELDAKLGAHISRYLKNATVRATVLTRVAILGAVQAPGFYYVSPDRPISDLVMTAGGPAGNANIRKLEIVRGKVVVLASKKSSAALESGKTLEQLDVQSGDEIRVAANRDLNWNVILRLVLVAVGVFFSLLQFLQWYYNRQDF
jgi:protein involved in polysaccharide export with SLBB domain